MPKTILVLGQVQTIIADAFGEPVHTLHEIRRYANELTEAQRELKNLPGRELGADWVRARTNELRQTANGPCSPTAIAHDAFALLTDAPSRRLTAARSWALMFALPAGDALRALDACPVTGALWFGSLFIRLLSDEKLFDAASVLSVSGNKGFVLIEFGDRRSLNPHQQARQFCSRFWLVRLFPAERETGDPRLARWHWRTAEPTRVASTMLIGWISLFIRYN